MTRKKYIRLIAVVAAACIMFGCGAPASNKSGTEIKVSNDTSTAAKSSEDTEIKVSVESTSENSSESSKSSTEEAAAASSGQDDSLSSQSVVSTSEITNGSPDEAVLAFNLYNGYSWVTDGGVDSCYDENGKLLFTLPEGTRAASVFYNGYAAVMQKDDRGVAYVSGIVNTKGEIVLDAEKIGADGFVFGIYENQPEKVNHYTYSREKSGNTYNDFETLEPVEDRLLEDGYIFAYTFSESYSGTDFEVGLVDMQGNWVYPLQKDNIATLKGWYSPGALLGNLTYCKEGIWMWATTGYGELDEGNTLVNYYFYNIQDNHWAQLIGDNINSHKDTFGLTFENGVALVVGMNTSGMSYIYPPEGDKKTFEPVNKELQTYMYFDCYDRDSHVIFADQHNGNTPDENGIVILDEELNEISRIKLHEITSVIRSSSGYLPVNIENENGTEYWGILCADGEFLFEPKEGKLSGIKNFKADDQYLIFWIYEKYFGYGCSVRDLEGNEVYSSDNEYDNIRYHNGVLRLDQGGNIEYVKL